VHAVGFREPGDVGAIVDDDAGAKRVRARHDLLADGKECRARFVLAANLEEPRPARQIRIGERWERPPRATRSVGVEDGVERRKGQTASA
jgi:hypothetical protein